MNELEILVGMAEENRSIKKIICSSATMSTTNSTWTGMGLGPGLRFSEAGD